VHVGEAAEVVHKDGSNLVALGEEVALVLAHKTRDRGFQLINWDAFPRSSGSADGVGLSLGAPRTLGCTTVQAGLTLGNTAACKTLWKLSSGSHEADVGEGEVSKAVVPSKKLGLGIESGSGSFIIGGGQVGRRMLMVKVKRNDIWALSGDIGIRSSIGWWRTDRIVLIISLKAVRR